MLTLLAALAADSLTRFIGEVALFSVAAIVLGFIVYKVLPAAYSPKLFAVVGPFLLLGLMAYLGIYAAAAALAVFVLLALAVIALGL